LNGLSVRSREAHEGDVITSVFALALVQLLFRLPGALRSIDLLCFFHAPPGEVRFVNVR
jgi:hypothetical protein